MSVQKIDFDPLSREVVDSAFKVHQYFGSGLVEKIYEEALCRELQKRDIPFERQFHVPVYYEGEMLDCPMRLDFLINFNDPYFKTALKRFALTSSSS
jgi:GxxExxY protein